MDLNYLSGLGFDQYADLLFALLVAGVCLRTLIFDRDTNTKQRIIWKRELSELEQGLRELIKEASESSILLDQKLKKREDNIEKLYKKSQELLETSISNSKLVKKESQSLNRNWSSKISINKDDDIGKEWQLQSDSHERKDVLADTSREELEQRINEAKLAKLKALESERLEEEIFSQTSIVDPVAFRIAKRLLLEGKELHVIARKLEMPVSEIRHLETLIRQKAKSPDEGLDLPETFTSKAIDKVNGIIRDPYGSSQGRLSLLEQIEKLPSNLQQQMRTAYEQAFEEVPQDQKKSDLDLIDI